MKDEKVLHNNNEQLILEKVRSGDNVAISRLYRTNFPALYHFIINNSGNLHDATETYQQAFIIFYEKLQDSSFRLHSSAGTFIYAVGKNLWLAALKEKRKYTAETPDDLNLLAEPEDMEQLLKKENELKRMDKCLDKLGEPCKTVLKAYYHEGLSMEDIAKKMGYTNSATAKNQKYKCLLRLKRLFSKLKKEKIVY